MDAYPGLEGVALCRSISCGNYCVTRSFGRLAGVKQVWAGVGGVYQDTHSMSGLPWHSGFSWSEYRPGCS